MFTRLTGVALSLSLLAFDVSAQEPWSSSAVAPTGPSGSASSAGSAATSSGAASGRLDRVAPSSGAATAGGGSVDAGDTSDGAKSGGSTGKFEAGMRLGLGVPLGRAGSDLLGTARNVSDLTPWRVPVWVDAGYYISDGMTLGLYGQIGVGGEGDACTGNCDWSDLRVGAEAEWRMAPGAGHDPWLGVGVGYESLSFRSLSIVTVPDPVNGEATDVSAVRSSERLSGPELLLQGGVDFRVDDSLSIGPYASATLGLYMADDVECPAGSACPGGSLDGSGVHSWVGVGLRGTYLP
jgi:hypothetical protein